MTSDHHITHNGTRERMRRRTRSIAAVTAIALVTLMFFPILLVAAAAADLLRARTRLPTARLVIFVLAWSWLELAGLARAAVLWATGRGGDLAANYELQSWWAQRLMGALRTTFSLRIQVGHTEAFQPGPVVVFSRHASLADSLLTSWCLIERGGLRPRVVMKRELLADPCLDVVGNRVPNYFLDRNAADSARELRSIAQLSEGMGERDAAVIFPEGTRANDHKRQRALDKIATLDPDRAERLSVLRHLLPPRPSGAFHLLEGCPAADLVLSWHTGFEGMDSFGGIIRTVGRGHPRITVDMLRIPRSEVPSQAAEFERWLDDQWIALDERVQILG